MEKLHLEPNLMDLRYFRTNYTWSPTSSFILDSISTHCTLKNHYQTKSHHRQHLTMTSSALNLPPFELKKSFFHHASTVEYIENWASLASFTVRDHPKGFSLSWLISRLSIPLLYKQPIVVKSTVLPSHHSENQAVKLWLVGPLSCD